MDAVSEDSLDAADRLLEADGHLTTKSADGQGQKSEWDVKPRGFQEKNLAETHSKGGSPSI